MCLVPPITDHRSLITSPPFLKLFLGREEDPFRVPFGDAENPADLGLTEPFDLEEHEDSAALLRQLREKFAERHSFGLVNRYPRAFDHERLYRRLHEAAAALPHTIVTDVPNDTLQPAQEVAFS